MRIDKLLGHRHEEEDEVVAISSTGLQWFVPSNGVVALFDEITPETAAIFIDQLMSAFDDAPDAPITIFIDSPGGSVYSTLSIINAIRSLPVPTIGIVTGMAASGGFYVLQACTHRCIMPLALMLWHEMISLDFNPTTTAAEAAKKAADYQKLNKHLVDFLKERITIADDVWQKTFTGHNDITFNAKEAKKLNLVDCILSKLPELGPIHRKLAREQDARNEPTRSKKEAGKGRNTGSKKVAEGTN